MTRPTRGTVRRTRDGRMLCAGHATSGAPSYHYEACDACKEARAKGIMRPDADSVPARLRGRGKHLEKQIDWQKIPPQNRASLTEAIQAGKWGRT